MSNKPLTQAQPPSEAVLIAANEIKAIRALTIQMVQIAEAQVMERLWTIRKEFTDEHTFGEFVCGYIGIDAKTAVRYVVTWDGARQNRNIRELANQDPDRAMAFVQRLTDSGIADELIEDDSEVARLLSMPARKQHQALRELIDISHAVADKRHPADRERIKTLEAERDSAVEALRSSNQVGNVVELGSHPAVIANGLVDELLTVESTLANLAQRAEQCLTADTSGEIPAAVRERMLSWGDLASNAIERVMHAALNLDAQNDKEDE